MKGGPHSVRLDKPKVTGKGSTMFERLTQMTDANWYGNVFKAWQVKQLGPKPSAEMLANVHGLGARPGKQALAIAMGLRDCGVTGSQIVIACGAPQLNKLRGYVADAKLKRLPTPPAANGHTVYKLELTAKGKACVERDTKRKAEAEANGKAGDAVKAAKPVKAKAKAKATGKAAKAAEKPVEGGHVAAAHITADVTPETGDQPQS